MWRPPCDSLACHCRCNSSPFNLAKTKNASLLYKSKVAVASTSKCPVAHGTRSETGVIGLSLAKIQNGSEKQRLSSFLRKTSCETLLSEVAYEFILWQTSGFGQGFPFAEIWARSSSTRRGRSGGAGRPVLLARSPDHDEPMGLYGPAFPFSIPNACDPRDSRGRIH